MSNARLLDYVVVGLVMGVGLMAGSALLALSAGLAVRIFEEVSRW